MLFVWLVVLQLVVFLILVFFLRLYFSRNVSSATAHLHELNADYSQKLEEAKKRQVEADKYYNDMVTKAKAEAERSKVQILTEARETQASMLADARRQSQDIISQATNARQEMLDEVDQNVELRSTEKAAQMLEATLPEIITKQLHEQWVAELLKNGFGELPHMNLPADVKEAKVVSAYPLSAEQRAALQKKIRETIKKELPLTAEVDGSLVAGLVVSVGSMIVDGSLRLKIKDFVRNAQNSARR